MRVASTLRNTKGLIALLAGPIHSPRPSTQASGGVYPILFRSASAALAPANGVGRVWAARTQAMAAMTLVVMGTGKSFIRNPRISLFKILVLILIPTIATLAGFLLQLGRIPRSALVSE